MAAHVSRNIAVTFVGDVITNLLALLLTFLVARKLGAAGLGAYSFAFAFASLFIVLSEFGTLTFLVKEVAADKSKAPLYVRSIAFLKFIFGLVTFGLSVMFIMLTKGSDPFAIRLVVLASIVMFFNYYGYLFRAVFQAYERMEFDAFLRVLEKFISVGSGIILLFLGYGLEAVIIAQVVSYFIVFVVSWVLITKKFVPLGFHFDKKLAARIIVSSAPFWLTSAFIYIYFRIDTVMLSFMTDYVQVGLYNAGYKFLEALAFFQTAVLVSVFPTFSRLHMEGSKENLSKFFKESFYFLFSYAAPLCLGGLMVSLQLLSFVYGQPFTVANSVLSLKILFIALFFLFVNYIMGFLLNSINKGKQFTIVAGIAVIVNVVTNLIVIPKYGIVGSSFATVLTEIVNFGLLFYLIKKSGFSLPFVRLLKPAFCAGLMFILLYFFQKLWLDKIFLENMIAYISISVIFGAFIYFASMIITKGFDIKEMAGVVSRWFE